MTTRKRATAAKRAPAKRAPVKRTTKSVATKRSTRSATSRRRPSSTRRPTTPRRRTTTATTLGAGAGTVVVAFLLGAPWSVRIALLGLVILAGAGYLLWSRRS